jgi:predicted nuclease of predicted toxin-antitoxin system
VRLLADENFPGEAVAALRQRGHDVAWLHVDAPCSTDPQVLARAQAEGRIVLTFDKDFDEPAFRAGLPATSGVIPFRISTPLGRFRDARAGDGPRKPNGLGRAFCYGRR